MGWRARDFRIAISLCHGKKRVMKNKMLVAWFVLCPALCAQEGRKPEVASPLGKSYYSKPADDELRAAEKALAEKLNDPDRMIAAGRSYDRLLQFSNSIPLYTRVIGMMPNDVRAYRFRGHRYISTRRFTEAVADLRKAEKIAPDSFDVLYHLALAQYLSGRFADAAASYGRCLEYKGKKSGKMPQDWRSCADLDDESRVAMLNWRYAAFRRAKRPDEARKLLDGVHEGMSVKENIAYLQALLFYKGVKGEDVFATANLVGSSLMALGYPIGNFALMKGDTAKACELFRKLVSDDANWAAFGFIAAEVELSRPGMCKSR
jgi:tetratricopeptide (TPR) repeat protein